MVFLFAIIIEALAGLLAQQAAADHLLQQQSGTILAVAGLVEEGLHDGQAHVQTDEVAQSEGAHGMVCTQLHSLVDILHRGNAGLNQADGLVDHGDQDLVDDETGSLGDLNGLLADLLGQLMASSFGLAGFDKPLFGVYGACSTMGESIGIGSMLVEGGFADYVLAMTSSHFASAEKEFRFPLAYGNQRPLSATWTVTGSGACVLSGTLPVPEIPEKTDPLISAEGCVQITGLTTGKLIDFGLKDSLNMG